LREVRLRAGLSGKDLSRLSGWQASKVSRLETARQLPTEPDVLRWSEVCGAGAAGRDELLALREAATGAHRAWQHRARQGLPAVQADYNDLVARSHSVRHFETTWVPGLLQTPGYARAVLVALTDLAGIAAPDADLDAAVALRMQRQQHLYDTGRRFEFLVTEPVLRWGFCPTGVMRTQLDRLRGVIGLPHVRFGIVPQDAPIRTPPQNAFQLYDDAAVVETFVAESTHSPEDSAAYARVLDRLWDDAVEGDPAIELLDRATARLR
jgi:transcriptional regulator with XRE-family HTH domain